MRSQILDTLSKRICRGDVDLVQQEETPFSTLQKLHKLLGRVGTGTGVGDHAVYGNNDPGCTVLGAGELIDKMGQQQRSMPMTLNLPARQIAR